MSKSGAKMSVDQTDKIDFFVVDKEKTQVVLIIADHLDWEEFDEGDHLELLQEKINSYLHFVEGGQLIETRPDLEGIPVVIRVDAKYPPSEEATKFYRLAGPVVADAGMSLELYLRSIDSTQRF
jgi:hypothetical protein